LKQNHILEAYLVQFKEGGERFTERSFEVVAGSFWDIVKTSSSYKGIGMAMKAVGLYEPAVKELNKGLEDDSIDKFEQLVLLISKGDALLWLGSSDPDDKEKSKRYLEESLSILTQANEAYRQITQIGQIDDDLRAFASTNFANTAHAAALLGKADLVLSVTRERLETKARFPQYALSVVIDALQQHGHLSSIVELLKLLPKIDVIWYLVTNEAGTAQEAAMRSGEGQYLLDLYDTARKTVGTWSSETGDLRARLESSAATFARQALGSLDVAKTLLREMINNPKTPSWRVLEGCNQLAEILLEDFRLSKDPLVKKSALEETLKLLDKPAEVLPHVYNAAESQMIITIALMLRRLGPALDFSSRLHATFANCTAELRDDTGVNDSNAFRRLARVLICVPGFDEEASIALTLQLYIIDEDVRRKEQEIAQASQEKETQASTDSESHTVNETSDQDVGVGELSSSGTVQSIDAVVKGDVNHSDSTQNSINGTTDGVKTTNQAGDTSVDGTPGSTTTVNEIDEGILENSWFYCNFCGKDFNDWSHGAAYLCVYCIDMDICEECYLKKLARERGEIEPDWRVVCPKGHRHVKAPIEGWRGIRAGTMRIGKDEILFKTWLAQLEIKWAKYWEDFWTDAETV
jgi:tetratricopeptide (TPR) repeat protein